MYKETKRNSKGVKTMNNPTLDGKKILIVGGCGYIGGHLTDLLCGEDMGCQVTVYDCLLYETRFLKKVDFIYGDIKDTARLDKLVHDFDVVVWLAAIVGDGACQVDEELTQDINENAVKWLVDNYKGRIVFTSTCSVYGVNNDLLNESAKPNPLSLYASTKLAAEKYVLEHANHPLVFRLGTLYGQSDVHSRIRLDLVVNILTKKAAQGEPLTVFGGEQWRPLLHVKDVSNAIIYGLENDIEGLYNLSSGNYRISEIADAIKSVIPSAKVESHDISFEDARNYKVDNSKFASKGWKPKHSIEEGIIDMLEMFTENRVMDINDSIYSNVAHLKSTYNVEKIGEFY